MSSILSFFTQNTFGFTLLDAVLFFVFVFYAIEGISVGFFVSLFDLISFIASFFVGILLYTFVGNFFVHIFTMPQGFANAIGFFIISFVSELIFSHIFRKVSQFLSMSLSSPSADEEADGQYLSNINHILGFLPGLCSAFILLAFFLSLLIAFPLSPFLKKTLTASRIVTFVLSQTQGFEKNINGVFGQAITETMNFLTVEPESNQTVQLNFKVTDGTIDQAAEEKMLTMVNQERTKQGLSTLQWDERLTALGREYAKDMFAKGYFSHYTPDGRSPFDRMNAANINYGYAGENLALAPNTDLAMQGLMQSPGHRANILSVHFQKIGIGVIDGGIYGEMFVQEFTD